MKTYTLIQDNGACNDVVFSKISAKINEEELSFHLKKFFKWRKDLTIDRLQKQGSNAYDKFIKYLSLKGY